MANIQLINYIKLIRPVNLAIIAATQVFIYNFIIKAAFDHTSLTTTLSPGLFTLFVAVTLILAAGSYIINDICDNTEDHINKPKDSLSRRNISIKQAYALYYSIGVMGFLIAVYIAWTISKLHLLFIFPLAFYLLHLYSVKWKKKGFIGNLIVAAFCAFVIAIFLVAEPLLLTSESISVVNARNAIIVLSIFAFIINLSREFIKDIEDIEGDKTVHSASLPITLGIEKTKILSKLCLHLAILLIIIWLYISRDNGDFFSNSYAFLFLIAPLGVTITRITQAREKREFSFVSRLLKIIMLSGLIYFYIGAQSLPYGNF